MILGHKCEGKCDPATLKPGDSMHYLNCPVWGSLGINMNKVTANPYDGPNEARNYGNCDTDKLSTSTKLFLILTFFIMCGVAFTLLAAWFGWLES